MKLASLLYLLPLIRTHKILNRSELEISLKKVD